MSSTLYDLTMDLDSSDWLLSPFGDQLQAWSSGAADSLTCDIEDKVVQESSNAKTQSWCESNTANLLHNPVSPHLNQAYEESAFAVEWTTVEGLRKERYTSGDELGLKSVISPREVLYCQSVSETRACDKLAQVVEDPLDVFGSELFNSSPIQCHITDPQLNVVATFLTDANCLIEDHLSSASQLDQIIQSIDSLQSFYVISNANRSEVSVMQQVPSSPTTSLLPLDLDDDSYVYDETLTDPDTVCDLLQLLSSKNAIIKHSSISTHAGSKLNSEPLLSPMSPEDIDSILSVKDEIMSSISDADLLILGDDYAQNEMIFKSSRDSGYRKSTSSLPVSVMKTNVPMESRKLKKKEQNKSAAHRYRQKKREEKGVVLSEVDQLQLKNSELKARVEELNREIKYLKGLLDEIRRQ